ncbi:hypothetical protein VIGAN_11134900 [Vigna angularis var. angularis]|nr:hypothetical protein VIGAN_11134900 [Vigna angularis var. angularis]
MLKGRVLLFLNVTAAVHRPSFWMLDLLHIAGHPFLLLSALMFALLFAGRESATGSVKPMLAGPGRVDVVRVLHLLKSWTVMLDWVVAAAVCLISPK